MQKWWRSERFEALEREWNQILKETGFEDCEKEVAGTRVLKQTSDYAYRRKETSEITRENKLTYFMLLAQHVSTEKSFSDESDAIIMMLTSNGWNIKEISTELRKLGKAKHNRDTIRYIRRRYEHKWGIKTWKTEEMVSRRVRTR